METEAEAIATQFIVYQDTKYLRQNEFVQSDVTIGSSPKADLVLNHKAVADFHANVFFKGGQLFLINNKPNNGLRLNGCSVVKTALQLWDVIDIGPFSIVIQLKPEATVKISDIATAPVSTETTRQPSRSFETDSPANARHIPSKRYAVILKNEYANGAARNRVAKHMGVLFNTDPSRIHPFLNQSQHILKKDLSFEQAIHLQKILRKAGAAYSIMSMNDIQSNSPITEIGASIKTPGDIFKHNRIAKPEKSTTTEGMSGAPQFVSNAQAILEDDDDEDDDLPAPFTLKEKLAVSTVHSPIWPLADASMKPQFEIIRSMGERVLDVQYIAGRGRYRIDHDGRLLRLAELSAFHKGYVCFPETWHGYFLSNGRQTDLTEFKTDDYLHRKRKGLYRLLLSPGEVIVISADQCQYQISHSYQRVSPPVTTQPKAKEMTWRHWTTSVITHVVLVFLAAIIFSSHPADREKSKLYFVKINMSQLEQVKKKPPPKKLPPKLEKTPKPKKLPKMDLAQKSPKVKKVPKKKPSAKVAAVTKKIKNSPDRKSGGSHPKAGGGHGKGNVQNRNIKQTGILSLLGNAMVSGPSEAMAAITNLDAVPVPDATDKQFAVGGVKGALGTGKISVTSADMVQTKGTRQVLRSAGVGTVAALEKGQIGKKTVRGLIKAQMTRTVKVEGGMSRAMVKRVIDQHLEEIQYCYESALLVNPSIMGRIVYEWKIMMSGRVGEVRIVSSSVNSHQIHECIQSAIKSWQFPKPVGSEVVVSYPFVFDLVAF
jgi:outer membrane biosynthesis protein TonB